jgi:tetratricopeptide (TPR) repeat protein
LRSAQYEQALRSLHQLLAEEPRHGPATLLTAHALFGLEAFPQAAETLRSALSLLSPRQWGEGVQNYRSYFASPVEYADRLRALEAYVAARPDEVGGRLLLGYHYGYLGLRSDARRQLDRALAIDANDSLVAMLADQFRQQAEPASVPAASSGAGDVPLEQRTPPPEPMPATPEAIKGPLLVRPPH